MDFIILLALSIFTFLTVLYQLGLPVNGYLDWLDKIGILPIWSFFAPIPGVDDRRILYRDIFSDGSKSEWQEVNLFLKKKKNGEFLWNPNKHYQKGINDVIENLKLEATTVNNSGLMKLSWSYLMILRLVMEQPIPYSALTRHFIIVASHGFDIDRTLSVDYMSDYHKFE